MTQEQVVALMETSRSPEEWNNNCDLVKRQCDGYPNFWYSEIILSGIAARVSAAFGSDAELLVSSLNVQEVG